MVGENSKTTQEKVKKEIEELTFEMRKESIRDCVARVKALVVKAEQNNVSTRPKTKLIVESGMAFPPLSMLKVKCFGDGRH